MTDFKAKLWTVLLLSGGLAIVFLFVGIPGCSGIVVIPGLIAAAVLMIQAAIRADKNARFREQAVSTAQALPLPDAEPPMCSPNNHLMKLPIPRYE